MVRAEGEGTSVVRAEGEGTSVVRAEGEGTSVVRAAGTSVVRVMNGERVDGDDFVINELEIGT